MVSEVIAAGAPAQTVKTRSADLEQNQTARETVRPSRNEGVEVRISREDAQRTENQDLTYENLRPRPGATAEAQPNVDAEREARAEEAALEEARAREAARRESTIDPQQAGA